MNLDDKEKLMELIMDIQELTPELDCFIYTGESIIISSLEKIQEMADTIGVEVELESGEGIILEDEDDDFGGGFLQ